MPKIHKFLFWFLARKFKYLKFQNYGFYFWHENWNKTFWRILTTVKFRLKMFIFELCNIYFDSCNNLSKFQLSSAIKIDEAINCCANRLSKVSTICLEEINNIPKDKNNFMRSNSSYFAFADCALEKMQFYFYYYRSTQSRKSQPNLEIGKSQLSTLHLISSHCSKRSVFVQKFKFDKTLFVGSFEFCAKNMR